MRYLERKKAFGKALDRLFGLITKQKNKSRMKCSRWSEGDGLLQNPRITSTVRGQKSREGLQKAGEKSGRGTNDNQEASIFLRVPPPHE